MISIVENRETDAQTAEAVLIQRILGGEKDLFHDLVCPYERSFFLQAYSILRNPEDAEESVQQAMMKIYFHLAELVETSKFRQWAMRIVDNEARMSRRKRRQHLYEPLDQESMDVSDEKPIRPRQFADWRDLPIDEVEKSETRAAVAKALATLPEKYREVFILREMQHLDLAETVAVLGISEPAVKTRLHRARLMLREALTPFFAKPKESIWSRWKGVNPWLAAKR